MNNEYIELEKESSASILGGLVWLMLLPLFYVVNPILAIIHGISFAIFYFPAMDKLLTFDFNAHWHSRNNFQRFLFNAVPTIAIVRKYYIEKKEENKYTES